MSGLQSSSWDPKRWRWKLEEGTGASRESWEKIYGWEVVTVSYIGVESELKFEGADKEEGGCGGLTVNKGR